MTGYVMRKFYLSDKGGFSIQNLKYNKLRNICVLISIAVMSAILSAILNTGISMVDSEELGEHKKSGTMAEIEVTHPASEQIDVIKGLSYIESYGNQIIAGQLNLNDMKITLVNCDRNEWIYHRKELLEELKGTFPDHKNDIFLSAQLLQQIGITDPKIGMPINLNDYHFILSGYYRDPYQSNLNTEGVIYVSDDFAKESGRVLKENGCILIKFKKNAILESFRMLSETIGINGLFNTESGLISKLSDDINLKPTQEIKTAYEKSQYEYETSELFISYSVFMLPILLCGFLLIYNCFYLSLSKDIRQFGLLMAVGATSRQIKLITVFQASVLSGIGIPAGFLLSIPLCVYIIPDVLKTTTFADSGIRTALSPSAYIMAALLTFITVLTGSINAARKIDKYSVLESIRFVGINPNQRIQTSHGGRLYQLAFANILRGFPGNILIFISLWIGLTAFLTANAIVSSMQSDSFNQYILKGSDFILYNETLNDINSKNDKQVFSDRFLNNLKKMNGIKSVHTVSILNVGIKYDKKVLGKQVDYYTNENGGGVDISSYLPGTLVAIDSSYLEQIDKGMINLSDFENGKTILVSTDHPELFPVNGEISGVTEDGKNLTFKIGGFVPLYFQNDEDGACPNLYIHENVLNGLTAASLIKKIDINVEETSIDEFETYFDQFAENEPMIKVESNGGIKEFIDSARKTFYLIGYLLTIILTCIGILTFINTMIINIETRKGEFAILRSIGMTIRQLRIMLMAEGAFYAGIIILLTVSFGNLLMLGIFRLFQQEAEYAVFRYPYLPLFTSLLISSVLLICIPVLSYRKEERRSAAEILREIS
jgi:putative ABC transport system permease protein